MCRKMFFGIIVLGVTAGITIHFYSSGFAQEAGMQKKPQTGVEFMSMYDKDKDGKVSKEEFNGDGFMGMDKNGDGFIVLEEADQKLSPPTYSVNANQIAFIVKFAKDKDGKVSRTEFTGVHFSNFDKNGDGFIEPHEAPEGEAAY